MLKGLLGKRTVNGKMVEVHQCSGIQEKMAMNLYNESLFKIS